MGEGYTNAVGSGNFFSQQDNYFLSLNTLGKFPKVWLADGRDGVGGVDTFTWYKPFGGKSALVELIGGGQGGGTGGDSTFGSLMVAAGGGSGSGSTGDIVANQGNGLPGGNLIPRGTVFYGRGAGGVGGFNGGYARGVVDVNNMNAVTVNIGNSNGGIGGVAIVTTYGENFFP